MKAKQSSPTLRSTRTPASAFVQHRANQGRAPVGGSASPRRVVPGVNESRFQYSEMKKMVKIVFCLRRLPQLTPNEFQRYWREVHALLVRKHQKTLRIVRYVQFHSDFGSLTEKLRAFRNSPEPYDGVAEIWYENREALETLGRDPDARAASRELLEDEKRFVDLSRSPIWLGNEKVIISGEE
jgi:EthD domain